MARRFVFLLICLITLQWSAASVAAVCLHEADSGQQAAHVGHHEHAHYDATASQQPDQQALPESVAAASMSNDGGADDPSYHPDCAGCHLAASVLLPRAALAGLPGQPDPGVAAAPLARIDSSDPTGLYRPPRA